MIYLTAVGLTPGGSSTVHIYTQNNTQKNTIHELGRVQTVPRLCEIYPVIFIKNDEKGRKNLSQGSRLMETIYKTEYT
jgi:hypothetical protein